jgi:hypothetical protein
MRYDQRADVMLGTGFDSIAEARKSVRGCDTGLVGICSGRSMNVLRRKSKIMQVPGSFEDSTANRCSAKSKLATVSIHKGGPASASFLKMSYVVSVLRTSKFGASESTSGNLPPGQPTELSRKRHLWGAMSSV